MGNVSITLSLSDEVSVNTLKVFRGLGFNETKEGNVLRLGDIYALLEKAHMGMAKGVRPSLPLWLAPIQVRLIPVNEDHVKLAMDYAKKLTRGKVRSDVDDLGETDLTASSSHTATEHLVPLLIFPR